MKKRLLTILVPLAISVVFTGALFNRGKGYEAVTNEQRVGFIAQFGWQVEARPIETVPLTLPGEYDDVYKEYNKIQNAAGMNIKPYMGRETVRYTYKVKNHKKTEDGNARANLLVCDGKIIAADIMVVNIDGFMHAINKTEYVKN